MLVYLLLLLLLMLLDTWNNSFVKMSKGSYWNLTCITPLTTETTRAKNPIELRDWDGLHCFPPFSGMNTNGALGLWKIPINHRTEHKNKQTYSDLLVTWCCCKSWLNWDSKAWKCKGCQNTPAVSIFSQLYLLAVTLTEHIDSILTQPLIIKMNVSIA